MNYELELDKAVEKINKEHSSFVCIQLPDGMKPLAGQIADHIESKTPAKVLIWGGTCFGACDLPLEVERLGVDLIIHWGHAAWRY